MPFVLSLDDAHGTEAWRAGAKAAHLSVLRGAGFTVPNGFVVAAEALEHYLEANGLAERAKVLLYGLEGKGPGGLVGETAALRELVTSASVPPPLAQEVRAAWRALGGVPVSVRSSSSMEDRAEFSFAGQHDSLLNIVSEESLEEALKQCWASLWTDRAMHYLLAMGVSPRQLRMSVLVQELVAADVSGVAFTIHPVTGDGNHTMVSAAYGLGEATVSGEVSPDEALVQREPRQVASYTIGEKQAMVVPQERGGTTTLVISSGRRAEACLTTEQTLAVTDLALRVEERMGGVPQDVEWAFVGETLHLLQARPMVRVSVSRDEVAWESPVPGAHWRRNWRLGEWLSEPVTPLFATWMLPILVQAREEQGLGYLGWGAPESFAMPHPWFCIVNGYFYTRQDMSQHRMQAFGQQAPEQRAMQMSEHGTWLTGWRDELLPPYLERFDGHFQFNIAQVSSAELLGFTEGLMREAGEFWYLMAPIGFGFEEMSFKPYYDKLVPEEEGERLDYTAFFSGYPSPPLDGEQALYELAERVRADPALAQHLFGSAPDAVVQAFDKQPEWFRRAFQDYLSVYGHQLYNLDFYFPTMGEVPAATVAVLQGYLRFETSSPRESVAERARQREQAVRWVDSRLADRPEDRQMMRQVVRGFQALAAMREEIAFHFQRPWPLIRQGVMELGRRMAEAGVILDAEELFFLELDELRGAMAAMDRGEGIVGLSAVAMGRRQTWEHRRRMAAPARIPVDEEDTLDRYPTGYVRDQEGARLLGQPASPGRARGRARVVRSPEDMALFNKGEVLVTAAASPAYAPLLLLAAGWVTEAGGGASHSSLVARELGVPTVVGTRVATEVIKDGQLLELDGSRGIAVLLDFP
jgi:phosphohistidine swiveling domain-containing protein